MSKPCMRYGIPCEAGTEGNCVCHKNFRRQANAPQAGAAPQPHESWTARPWLRSITALPCQCLKCGWAGLTGDTESGEDGDLVCPNCIIWAVTIHYAPHERVPGVSIEAMTPAQLADAYPLEVSNYIISLRSEVGLRRRLFEQLLELYRRCAYSV